MSRYILLEDGGKIELEGLANYFMLLEGAAVWQLRRKGTPDSVDRVTGVSRTDRITSMLGVERIAAVDEDDRISSAGSEDRVSAPKGGE